MSENKEPNRTVVMNEDRAAIRGTRKYFAGIPKLTIAGVDYTPASLEAVFQGEIDALNAIDAARAQLDQLVADSLVSRRKVRGVRASLKKYIVSVYGADAVKMLGDFGMNAPKKPGPKKIASKLEAVMKSEATREARKPPKKA
jgi:hypothetical protein